MPFNCPPSWSVYTAQTGAVSEDMLAKVSLLFGIYCKPPHSFKPIKSSMQQRQQQNWSIETKTAFCIKGVVNVSHASRDTSVSQRDITLKMAAVARHELRKLTQSFCRNGLLWRRAISQQPTRNQQAQLSEEKSKINHNHFMLNPSFPRY